MHVRLEKKYFIAMLFFQTLSSLKLDRQQIILSRLRPATCRNA